ncbi:MAG: GNAT family N-acetyltransferase [Syntrophobacteraceae bacterium]
MTVETIDNQSPHLAAVKAIGTANKAILGFFPEGAFDEYAARKQILVALDPAGNCIGYLLYRISRIRIVIVHLCVDPSSRGIGVARALVDSLKSLTHHLIGIGLSCRRDYVANSIWPKLGFIAATDKVGRGKAGNYLTYWWFDHGHPSLRSLIQDRAIQQELAVAIDANVFFSLKGEESPESLECKALEADWIQESVSLCLTSEIFNEIERNSDHKERRRRRSHAKGYPIILGKDFQSVEAKLRHLFPAMTKPSAESDLRQLAHTISGGLLFFITRDGKLLEMSSQLYDHFGVSVMRPSDLITRVDEITREADYQPVRMAASLTSIKLVKKSDDPGLLIFQRPKEGERKGVFLRRLRGCLANPQFNETFTIESAEHGRLSLIVCCRESDQRLTIPLFRVAKGPLASTIARYLILKLILEAAKENRRELVVEDPYISPETITGLEENGFFTDDGVWVKINLVTIQTSGELVNELSACTASFSRGKEYLLDLSTLLKNAAISKATQLLLRIERSLWPTKITDLDIPSFIVSIKPQWALQLFDETLAKQTIFGARPELILNGENIYYRARTPRVLEAPGRILWYVKSDPRYPQTKYIRACSYLDEVVIDTSKNLFKRFQRFGVYKWKHVLEVSRGNPHGDIMAFRFSGTELFPNPISWERFQKILQEEQGRGSQIQSPVRVSSRVFERLYKCGTQRKDRKSL